MSHPNQAELQKILDDPSAAFKTPDEVVYDKRLSREQKIKILKQWAFDVRELEVAEEENMHGSSKPLILHQVLIALRQVEET